MMFMVMFIMVIIVFTFNCLDYAYFMHVIAYRYKSNIWIN
jgi:hypothetical protein